MSRLPKTDADRPSGLVDRRTVLRGVGTALCGGLLTSSGTTAGANASSWQASQAASDQTGVAHRLEQEDDCVALSPITGDVPVDEFYKYDEGGTRFSSAGPITSIQESRTSRLFLYRDPDDVLSLVVVHGQHHIEDVPDGGGSASFTFDGLPDNGEWVVRDDYYDGPELFDEWSVEENESIIHWTWQGGRTDGAVFEGLDDDFSITIEPAFNEDAELYDEHYEGDVEAWEALSGDQVDPEVVELAMDEPVILEANGC